MSILTVSNLKGGVGKTSLAINTAHALTKRHCETLLIDLDLQGDASQYLKSRDDGNSDTKGQGKNTDSLGSSDLFERLLTQCKSQIKEIRPGFSLLSGKVLAAYLPLENTESDDPTTKLLARLIEGLSVSYDNVVIDTPPSWGIMHRAALEYSSLVVVPIDPSEMSVRASISFLSKVAEQYPTPALLVRTMVSRMASKVAAYSREKLSEQFPDGDNSGVDTVSRPKKVTLRGLDSDSEKSPIYLSNSVIYRSELVHRLSYSHKTVYEQRGLEHLQQGYELLAKEAEHLIGIADGPLDLEEDYQDMMHGTIAGAVASRG